MKYATLLLALLAFPALALNLDFTWIDPTTREDGSPIGTGELSYCTLYKDDVELAQIAAGAQAYTENVSAGSKILYTLTCTDIYGIASAASDPVEVNLHRPAKPTLNVNKVSN